MIEIVKYCSLVYSERYDIGLYYKKELFFKNHAFFGVFDGVFIEYVDSEQAWKLIGNLSLLLIWGSCFRT